MTAGLARGDAEGMRGRNGGVRDSLWSTIRDRWFDASEWHLRLAGFHGRAGRTSSAEASYRKVLSRHPERLNALLGLGRLLLRGRRYDEAVEVCQRAVAVAPDAATAAFQLARALHRNGQVERAAIQYLRVVARQPTHDKAMAALEQIAKRLVRGDASAQGIEGATAAAEIGRQISTLGHGVQRAQDGALAIAGAISASATILASRAPQAALARFNAALGISPDLPEALRGAAACFERLGQFDNAVSALDRLIEINPQAIEPRLQRDRLRVVLDGSDGWMKPEAARVRDDLEREAMLARAEHLLAPERAAPAAALDPQKRAALLALAHRLVAPESGTPEATLDPQVREAKLARARYHLAPEAAAPASVLDPEKRTALLALADRLVAPEGGTPEAALGPREREALLTRARRMLGVEEPEPAAALDPQAREALLVHARRLLGPEEGTAAEAALDRQAREALLAHARRLLGPEGTAAEAALDPQAREALLARARRLLGPEEAVSDAALDPVKRQALLALARRLVAPERGTPEAALDPREREALLARARQLVTGPAQEAPASAEERANRASLDRLLQQARSAQNDGRLDEAEAIFLQVLDADEANTRALLGLSRLYMRLRRWADASLLLARLAAHQPASMEPRQMLARALLEEGRLDEAQRAYAALAALDPDNLAVWRSLGRIRGRLGDWAAARQAWSRVTEIDPESLDARLELASACHRAGDLDAARIELQRVLAREPDHIGALTQLARIDRNTNPEASFAGWSRLADLTPEAVEPRLQMARIHHQLQRLEEAEADYRAVLDRNPTHREALESLGHILEQRDPEAATRMFARWIELDPAVVDPWLAKGRFHARAGQPELAETAFRRAVEMAPSDVKVLTALGRFYWTTRRLDESLELWTRLQELVPEALEPKLQIARVLHARRDPGAVEALLNVLKIDLEHPEALRRLTQVVGQKDAVSQRALELWDQLPDVRRDSVPSILLRARLLEQAGRTPEAEVEYRLALALDNRSMIALSDFAAFLSGQERWEEAIEVQRAQLLIEPERIDILLGIGRSFNRLDRLQEAQESYEQALALNPDDINALGYLGRLLRTIGQVDASIAAFRRVCDLDPRNIPAWRELIFYLAGAEREAEALAALDEAEVALGETPETWVALGSAAEAALFGTRAIAYFERAIAARPDSAEFHAQLGLYYFRQGILDGALHHLLDSRDIDPGDVRHLTPANIETGKRLFETTRVLRELGFDHVAMRRAPRTVGEILIPERLFEHVRRIAETRVKPYEVVPRRIVAISATLAPGGAERQLVNMLRGLSNPIFGLDLSLFCISLSSRSRRDFFLPTLEGTGVDVVVPDPTATNDYLWDPEVAPFADVIRHFPADMVGAIAFWLQEFRRRRPEVVHAWQDTTNLTAVVAALLAGVPRIVLCCRSVRPDNPRRRLRRFMREAYLAVLDHPAVVLSNNSRAGANDYAQWLELDPERVEVVYNGIDFDRIDSSVDPAETARARKELGIPSGASVLGGVYRMSEEKRPLLWLDVAAAVARQNDAVHFVVCGDGPMRDEMRSYASTLGIADRVHLPGAQSNIGSWYKMMDVVMLTSRHEGLPNVLLEAQSLGIPVVAPDVGGMSEVVEQGVTGWTIRDADANSLAERVLQCLTDFEWRQIAAERAPRFVRDRFGVETMLRRNLEVYGIAHEAR